MVKIAVGPEVADSARSTAGGVTRMRATLRLVGLVTTLGLVTSCGSATPVQDAPGSQSATGSSETPVAAESPTEVAQADSTGPMSVLLSSGKPDALNYPHYAISGDWVVGWDAATDVTADSASISAAGYNWRTGQSWTRALSLPSAIANASEMYPRDDVDFVAVGSKVAVIYHTELPPQGIQAAATGSRIITVDAPSGQSGGEGCLVPDLFIKSAGSDSQRIIAQADASDSRSSFLGIDPTTCKTLWQHEPSGNIATTHVSEKQVVLQTILDEIEVLDAATGKKLWGSSDGQNAVEQKDVEFQAFHDGLMAVCVEGCTEGIAWYEAATGKIVARYANEGLKSGAIDGITGATYAATETSFDAWDLRSKTPRLTIPKPDPDLEFQMACAGRVWYAMGGDPEGLISNGAEYLLLNGSTGQPVEGAGSDGYEWVQCLDDKVALYTDGARPLPDLPPSAS